MMSTSNGGRMQTPALSFHLPSSRQLACCTLLLCVHLLISSELPCLLGLGPSPGRAHGTECGTAHTHDSYMAGCAPSMHADWGVGQPQSVGWLGCVSGRT